MHNSILYIREHFKYYIHKLEPIIITTWNGVLYIATQLLKNASLIALDDAFFSSMISKHHLTQTAMENEKLTIKCHKTRK